MLDSLDSWMRKVPFAGLALCFAAAGLCVSAHGGQASDTEQKVEPSGPAPKIEGVPPDSPEQAALRSELKDKGYIYLPRGNQLYRVNADGTDLRKIMEVGNKESIRSSQVSWDGKDVAVVVYPPYKQTTHEVRLIDCNGGNARKVFSSENRPSVAWTPDSAWMVILDGTKVMAVNRGTGESKQVLEVELTREVKGTPMTFLSADRQGSFYFWGDYVRGGNAFTVDKDCNLSKGLFDCEMKMTCQPRVSPDGTTMARHEHDYEWLGGNKRGWISERPSPEAGGASAHRFFHAKEDMPMRGWMDAPFWSPDGTYLAYIYKPEAESLKKIGFAAEKDYAVVAISRRTGGPLVWLAPGGANLSASWGPVPE